MCGILGYIGFRKASEVILTGLKKLEYRGYDSAGIATLSNKKISVIKDIGRIDKIHEKKNFNQLEGTIGIGHTRWATHGKVTVENAHPHWDSGMSIYLVHNGVIENYAELKRKLELKGHKFISETDTEVIAHLIEEEAKNEPDFGLAFSKAISNLLGSWSIVAMKKDKEEIHISRNGPPLVIGIGNDEMFCASDVPALLDYTKSAVFIEDNDRAVLKKDGYEIFDLSGNKIKRKIHTIKWTPEMAEKEGFEHFMQKEIFEQATRIRDALASDVKEAVGLMKNFMPICVIACGSSYYAGLVFKHVLMSKHAMNCEVFLGSEFQYTRTGKEKLVIAISQSGETADTLSAVRLAKKSNAKIIAITNVVGSSLYREADAKVIINAGPELAVVATKSFTCQIAVLMKIALTFYSENNELFAMQNLPDQIEEILQRSSEIEKIAIRLAHNRDFFFIGRSLSFPTALEGALKLKEITYLHAEAYAAGELKHGPLSLLEKDVVVIAIAPSNETLPKMLSNIEECRARDASIVVFSDSDMAIAKSSIFFKMPKSEMHAMPILYAVPLQLLSYYMAIKLGRDPDKPRNLAKSVTVE